MKSFPRSGRVVLGWILVAGLAALPAYAGDDVIEAGVDLWSTAGGELTFTSFASDPIPADFFCAGSAPFDGKLNFRGRPLATEPAGALGAIDTIVHRLDDAAFDADKIARTRIQLLALSLEATEPLETSCGRYEVTAALAGEQPVTEMKIYRTSDEGGVFKAPLDLAVELAFAPAAGNPHPRRTLAQRIELGPGSHSVWSYRSDEPQAPVTVDTDGDRVADTALPPRSNFLAGMSPTGGERQAGIELAATAGGPITCPAPLCPYYTCHCTGLDDNPQYDEPAGDCESDHLHCTWVCANIPGMACISEEAPAPAPGPGPGPSPVPGSSPEI